MQDSAELRHRWTAVVTARLPWKGAESGNVLKIETTAAAPQVPYGVVSSRHGKGLFAVQHGVGDVEVATAAEPAAT